LRAHPTRPALVAIDKPTRVLNHIFPRDHLPLANSTTTTHQVSSKAAVLPLAITVGALAQVEAQALSLPFGMGSGGPFGLPGDFSQPSALPRFGREYWWFFTTTKNAWTTLHQPKGGRWPNLLPHSPTNFDIPLRVSGPAAFRNARMSQTSLLPWHELFPNPKTSPFNWRKPCGDQP